MLIQVTSAGKTVYLSADKVIRLDPSVTPAGGTIIVSMNTATVTVANSQADVATAIEAALIATSVVVV